MRQEIKDIQLENGSFYIFNKNGFLKSKNRLFGKIGSYIIDKIYSHDIDEMLDLKINEFIKALYEKKINKFYGTRQINTNLETLGKVKQLATTKKENKSAFYI